MADDRARKPDEGMAPQVADPDADTGLEDGEMSIAPLVDTNRNTNLDRARREFRPVVPRPEGQAGQS